VLAEGTIHSGHTAKAAFTGHVGDAFIGVKQKRAGVSKAASCYVLIEGASRVARKDTAEIAGNDVKLVCHRRKRQRLAKMLVDIPNGASDVTCGLVDCAGRGADKRKSLGKDQGSHRLIVLFAERIILGGIGK
jgi:hypothetical protein